MVDQKVLDGGHLFFHDTFSPARSRMFERQSFVRIFVVLAELCLVTGAWATEASDLYRDGRRAEKAGHIAQAYLLYSEAAALDPGNHMYWLRSEALKTRATMEGKVVPQLASAGALPEILAEEADETLEVATALDLAEARKPLPPTQLKA